MIVKQVCEQFSDCKTWVGNRNQYDPILVDAISCLLFVAVKARETILVLHTHV